MKLTRSHCIGLTIAGILSASTAPAAMIEDIQFIPGADSPQLVIHFNGEGSFDYVERKQDKQVLIDMGGLNFPADLTRKIDTSALPGPVVGIVPYNIGGKKGGAKVLVQLKQAVEISVQKGPGEYRLSFSAPRGNSKQVSQSNRPWRHRPGGQLRGSDRISTIAAADEASDDPAVAAAQQLVRTLETPKQNRIYKGSKITIEADAISVHDIFRLVGSASGLNIVSSADVQGNINLSLVDVPWDQVLDIVLQDKSLTATSTGNVVRITTVDNYNREQDAIRQMLVVKEKVEPVLMAIIPINFAKAEEIQQSISALLVGAVESTTEAASTGSTTSTTSTTGSTTPATTTTATTDEEALQAFARGKIEVDARTNSLLITHTADQIKRIRALVKELDVPTPQVLIEAKVVQASDNFARSVGVSWGGFFRSPLDGAGGAGIGVNGFTSDAALSVTSPGQGGTAAGIRLGAHQRSFLQLNLEVAEANGQAKIMASPRLIVNNKQSANITDGQQIPIVTPGTATTPPTTEFRTAALTLSVTPQITNSGQVLMDLTVNNDSPVTSGAATGIATKSIQTQVLVESGSTLVLGGVYSYTLNKDQGGVPLLMDLPILGQLFKRERNSQARSELLIFVSPRVLQAAQVEETTDEYEPITL